VGSRYAAAPANCRPYQRRRSGDCRGIREAIVPAFCDFGVCGVGERRRGGGGSSERTPGKAAKEARGVPGWAMIPRRRGRLCRWPAWLAPLALLAGFAAPETPPIIFA